VFKVKVKLQGGDIPKIRPNCLPYILGMSNVPQPKTLPIIKHLTTIIMNLNIHRS
jgi:hypothetical protein